MPSTSPPVSRRPRAQSAAGIGRLPTACTSPSRRATVPVPTTTAFLPATISPGGSWPSAGSSGPSLSRSPAYVVQAPGAGVQARTCRSIAAAGWRPVDPRVVDGDLGGERDVVGRLRTRLERAVGDAVEGGDEQAGARPRRAGRAGRRRCRAAGSSRSSRPNVGPASSSWTIRNVVAPVTSSPAQIERCTGAAPRQAGSSEKCRLTQPWGGMSSADCGQQRAVRHDRAGVGGERAQRLLEVRVARVVGLEHRDAERVGAPRRPARRRAGGRARRRVGAGDDADQLVAGLGDRLQRRQRHLGRAGEDDPHRALTGPRPPVGCGETLIVGGAGQAEPLGLADLLHRLLAQLGRRAGR